MKLKNLLLIFMIIFSCLIFVSSANAAVFDSDNAKTDNIQQVINNPTGDNQIIIDGSKGTINNLSTININRSNIKISGINGATIIRNTSDTSNRILFDITGFNIIIENLTIQGYNTTINANTSNLTIQDNIIDSINTGLTVMGAFGNNIENIKILNNNIKINQNLTGRTGISVYSFANISNFNITGNNIELNGNSDIIGVSIASEGTMKNGTFLGNNITVTSESDSIMGIDLSAMSTINDLNFTNNNVKVAGNNSTSAINLVVYDYFLSTKISNVNFTNNNMMADGNLNVYSTYLRNNRGNISDVSFINNTMKTSGSLSAYGVYTFSYAGNFTDFDFRGNNVTVNGTGNYISGAYLQTFGANIANVDLQGNNLIMLSNGSAIDILAVGSIKSLNASHNRILSNNTFITLSQVDASNRFFANWLGNNTPDLNKIINISMDSYYVMSVNLTNGSRFVGDNWIIDYKFLLNGTTNAGNWNILPIFFTDFTDNDGNLLVSILDRESQIVNVPINKVVTNVPLYITTDYETLTLYVSSQVKPTPKPDKPSNNPADHAAMKETGMPIITGLLVLLSRLGLIARKK